MADIQSKVLSKYGIDINQVNIPKLYKVESANITPQELEEKITACRKKWQQSVNNGTVERIVERDKAHLAKADDYEKLLRDNKILKEIISYYNKGAGSSASDSFAKEYFELIASTKKIKKADIEFFFDYFQEERKNKKAILEMLGKDFKVGGLGKESSYADDDKDADEEGKKKKDGSPLIVNLFQKATVLKLRKCVIFYEKACANSNVCEKYPNIRDGLYEFLEINKEEELPSFITRINQKSEKAFSQRQEFGQDFVSLVDLFNILKELATYQDVVDNFTEFKLLLKYPKLTPYMYEFDDMKQDTLKKLFEVANHEYVFRDMTDFILSYFKIVYDNFNIHDQAIKSALKNAEKKAKKNAILNAIDEKIGQSKKRKVPVWVNIVHWLVYWPIFACYFVFEVSKAIITEAWKLAIPVFVVLFIGANWLFPKLFGIENLLALGKMFTKAKWLAFVEGFLHVQLMNTFYIIMYSLIAIILMLLIYGLPAFLVSMFIYSTDKSLSDLYDWVGLERTFKGIFDELRRKTEDQYNSQRKLFFKKKIGKIVCNIICAAAMAAIVYLIPIGIHWLSKTTGWG